MSLSSNHCPDMIFVIADSSDPDNIWYGVRPYSYVRLFPTIMPNTVLWCNGGLSSLLAQKRNQCLLVIFLVQANVILHNVQYHVSEHPEQAALQWIGEIIHYHQPCRTMLNPDLLLFDPVCDEEISNINVFGSFAT